MACVHSQILSFCSDLNNVFTDPIELHPSCSIDVEFVRKVFVGLRFLLVRDSRQIRFNVNSVIFSFCNSATTLSNSSGAHAEANRLESHRVIFQRPRYLKIRVDRRLCTAIFAAFVWSTIEKQTRTIRLAVCKSPKKCFLNLQSDLKE